MSTNSNTYIMVGQRFEYDYFSEEEHEDLLDEYRDSAYKGIQHKNGLCAVVDVICGKYVFIGRVLEKTDDQNSDYGISKPFNATEAMNPKLKKEVKNSLKQFFNIEVPEAQLWIFTNYR